MNGERRATDGVVLAAAYPAVIELIRKGAPIAVLKHIEGQLNQVFVPSQILDGAEENFSFMAFPIPRLSVEQRLLAHLQEETEIEVMSGTARIRIVLDEFDRISWFYVEDLPQLFHALKKYMPMTDLS